MSNQSLNHTGHVEQSYVVLKAVGTRVLIPSQGRQKILEELHIGHPGMSKMKALAHTVIGWPKLDSEIEEMVRCCDECQMTRPMPPVAPLNPLPWPVKP